MPALVLVTRGHFRSRDKDGVHAIPSAVAENPMLQANVMHGSEFYRSGVIANGSFELPEHVFLPMCSCDLNLDPMNFIHELDPYCLEIYRMCENELLTSRPYIKAVSQRKVHLVTRGHFRSRDKDGGHTLRSVLAENSSKHANLSFIEPELWAIEVLRRGNSDFRPFLLL